MRKEGDSYDGRTIMVSRHRNDKYNDGILLSVNEARLWNLEFVTGIDPSISSRFIYFFSDNEY